MGIPINFQTILDGVIVENERIEFKQTWDPQSSLKTICAFANDLNNWGGGYIVIGVREKEDGTRELMGVNPNNVDACLKDILNKSRLIQPAYCPVSDVVEHAGKIFIVLWCPGGSTRPYSSPKSMGKKSERVRWVRRLSSTVVPSMEEERDLYSLANNVPFDDRPNHTAEVSDLSPILVKAYLKAVGSSLYTSFDQSDFVEICRAMRIVDGPVEYPKPLNVGLLFFSLDPKRFFPYAQIDVVEFPQGEGGDTIIEHSFSGPVHEQLENALRYLGGNVVEECVVKQSDGNPSVRFFSYPPDALKEALANAVYHKSYEQREPIEVRVLPDRIEILSYPGADRSISLKGLKDYRLACRRYRNRRIGEFLKELGLTEGRNTGIHKILRALRENGSPDPLFETDSERLYFMVTLYARSSVSDGLNGAKGMGDSAESSEHVTGFKWNKIAERRESVLRYFAQNPVATIAECGRTLGITSATLNRDVAEMRAQGKLKGNARETWTVDLR